MNKIELLKKADKAYHSGSDPIMSDTEYDILKEQARSESPSDPYFKGVGAPVTSSRKVKLPFTMGSLNKVKPDGTLTKWNREHPGLKVASLKLDGSSIMVEYVDSVLTKGWTRGDGTYGVDISGKVHKFCPKVLDKHIPGIFRVRGECMLVGNKYKELGFKTRRNGVSGLVNQISDDNCEHITFMAHGIIEHPEMPDNEGDRLQELGHLGFNTPDWIDLPDEEVTDDVLTKMFFSMRETLQSKYDIDGVVLTLNESEVEDISHPDNKVAWKINEEAVPVKVIDVEWNVGRTGRIVPTVLIEPTEIQGVTVSRATGFNAKFVEDGGIGKGAVIRVVRSGEVIPHLTEVDSPGEVFIPTHCPSCCEELKWSPTCIDLYCTNKNCPEQVIYWVENFLITLGAENITWKTLMAIQNYWEALPDLYELDPTELASLDGFGMKRADQIVREMQKTLSTTPDKLMAAFGLSGVALEVSRTVLKHHSLEELLNGVPTSKLEQISGIGKVLANTISTEMPGMKTLYEGLLEKGLTFKIRENKLRGKIFTLTGNGPMKREVYVELIEKKGGYVKGISKKTDILVSAGGEKLSTKSKKAMDYGIPIITYEELEGMLK